MAWGNHPSTLKEKNLVKVRLMTVTNDLFEKIGLKFSDEHLKFGNECQFVTCDLCSAPPHATIVRHPRHLDLGIRMMISVDQEFSVVDDETSFHPAMPAIHDSFVTKFWNLESSSQYNGYVEQLISVAACLINLKPEVRHRFTANS